MSLLTDDPIVNSLNQNVCLVFQNTIQFKTRFMIPKKQLVMQISRGAKFLNRKFDKLYVHI